MNPLANSGPESRRRFLAEALAAGAVLGASDSAEAQDKPKPPLPPVFPPPPSRGPHLGTLAPFVRSQTVCEFPLSYLRPEFQDVAAWERVARGKVLELLHYSPPACDPQAETLERVDRGDYVQETVHFQTTPDVRVPACVLIPKDVRRPAPAIIALHDHGGFYLWGREKLLDNADEHPSLTDFKRQFYGGKSLAVELVRQGYVVIVIDMFFWGERRLVVEDDADDWRLRPRDITADRIIEFNRRSAAQEQLIGRTLYAAGITWSGVMYWDDIRTVDYLRTRPEVDPERIGCVGLSIGGLRACHLLALDERVKAGVVVGWMASFPEQLEKHVRSTIGFTKLVPGLYRHMDYPDVASLALPRALMVINGSRDGLFELNGVKQCFAKLESCYRKAGVPDKLRTRLYEGPHEFNVEMQSEAWEWLRRWV